MEYCLSCDFQCDLLGPAFQVCFCILYTQLGWASTHYARLELRPSRPADFRPLPLVSNNTHPVLHQFRDLKALAQVYNLRRKTLTSRSLRLLHLVPPTEASYLPWFTFRFQLAHACSQDTHSTVILPVLHSRVWGETC